MLPLVLSARIVLPGLAVLCCAVPSGAAATTRVQPLAGIPEVTGTATLESTGAQASMSAPAVRIDVAAQARVQTCLQVHVPSTPPQAVCRETAVDTRNRELPVVVAAPTVDRETTPGPGWVTGFVEVLGLDRDGLWARQATSWRAGAIADQSLPLTGVDEPGTTVAQGVPLPGTADGGADTGTRDSVCWGVPSTTTDPLPPGVTANALGPDAPAYSESGEPGGAVRGIALVVHGGGWTSVGSGAASGVRADAARWRARDWRTVNASYRPCATSVDDVLWFVDRIRQRFGTALPLCLAGTSAGGHLALLAAARRPDAVDCVSAVAGPSDLQALATQSAADPDRPGTQWTRGPIYGHNLAIAAFGAENLAEFSPTRTRIDARVLSATGQEDWLVPPAQVEGLATAQAALGAPHPVQTAVLAAGTDAAGGVPFGHGRVTRAALTVLHGQEDALATAAIADRGTNPPVDTTPPPVLVPGPPTPPTPPPITFRPPTSNSGLMAPPDPQEVVTRPRAKVTLSAPARARLNTVLGGKGIKITLRSSRAARATVRIALRNRTLLTRTVTLRAGRAHRLSVRLGPTARRTVRRTRGERRLRVSTRVRPRDGGTTVSAVRSVRLVRSR